MTRLLAAALVVFLCVEGWGGLTVSKAVAQVPCTTVTKIDLYTANSVALHDEITIPDRLRTTFIDRVNGMRKANGAVLLDVDEMVIVRTAGPRFVVAMFKDACAVLVSDNPMTMDGLRFYFNLLKSDDVTAFIESPDA